MLRCSTLKFFGLVTQPQQRHQLPHTFIRPEHIHLKELKVVAVRVVMQWLDGVAGLAEERAAIRGMVAIPAAVYGIIPRSASDQMHANPTMRERERPD